MKRKMIPLKHWTGSALCTLLLCASLACTACGSNTAEAPDPGANQNTATDGSEAQEEAETEADTSREEDPGTVSEDDTPESTESAGDPETDTTVSTVKSHITLETKVKVRKKPLMTARYISQEATPTLLSR